MQTQELLDRYEYTVKYQMQEIDRFRAELERRDEELTPLLAWINGDSDALVTLQRPSTPDRIKAAGQAVAYERYKLSMQLRVSPRPGRSRTSRPRPSINVPDRLADRGVGQQTWRIDLLPWNEHRPEGFAGRHNAAIVSKSRHVNTND